MRSARLAVAAALMVGLLAGACGGEEPAATGTAEESPAAEPTAAAEAETGAATEAATAGETTSPAAGEAAGAATVTVAETDLGTILTDADGRTLYLFQNDTGSESTCYDQCADNWPALTTEDDPAAGEGADAALLGTTERDDGTMQVTYDGHPLYYFAGDSAPGDVNGQGVGDVWYVVSPEGEAIGPS